MPSSSSKSADGGGRKRDRVRNPIPRARKKQKRLDAIRDNPLPPLPPPRIDYDEESASLRRSSRPRRVPQVLDSSPIPSFRRKNPNPPDSSKGKRISKGKEKLRSPLSLQEKPMRDFRSRLRPTAPKAGKGSRKGKEPMKAAKKDSDLLVSSGGEDGGEAEAESEKESEDSEQKVESFEEIEKIDGNAMESEQMLNGDDGDADAVESEQISKDNEMMPPVAENSGPEKVKENLDGNAVESEQIPKEDELMLPVEKELEDEPIPPVEKELEVSEQKVEPFQEKENLDGDAVAADELMLTVENKLEAPGQKVEEDKVSNSRGKERRRCGLCGGGTDGKPPKKLVRESADSDDEAYAGSSASEEPNYDVWDGFGDEPGWLGKLLGPIRDRFGIARLWVHQHCAVWSPEVYFAGLGCLKNVRAALHRGRALKCSRCGRPGATIGCRVDRCLRTYHLLCSRAEGCIFDHRKFLIACNHHRHLFQPHGIQYTHQIRKRKAKKLKLEMRKVSSDAWRKDVEAEEKWLENCGEDEEFLKREGKRLHRDILRIAPTYIGGSSENGNSYQGWESVAGLQDVIQCMKEVVILPLLYPDFFCNLGLAPPRGVLLHGYPGTGKTLVVRALVGACSRGDKRIAYFARKGADCLGKYVGDAERQLRLLFQVAERCQPSIIFFDEIDGLAPRRSRHQDQTHSSVVSTLLSLMDGVKSRGSVIVIGATNRPEAVDPALRRPGRFDREIYFPLPSEKDRSAILALHTQSWPNPVSGSLLSWIANQTVGYAGADLQALCTQAAMIALKRNCALQDLLSCAEKGSLHGRLLPLPSFLVEERDWLAALTLAPPPCSRREAGMAANDAVSSPLPTHLTPCLLQPLVHILISFYNDERIWLPLALFKASKSVKRIVISALEQKQIPVTFWRTHFHLLIQEPDITSEIEKNLFRYGLVLGPSVVGPSFMSDDDNDDQERSHTFRLKHPADNVHNISMQKKSLKQENLSGFRVLISGAPKSGQRHLVSCLLHGFMGHIEILKVNLATISQEGHGDLLRGLTQIFSKSVNVGRCMIYMPRIDLWAISETLRQDVEETHNDAVTCKSSVTAGVHSGTIYATELWSAFVEQVDSMSACTSLIIMATCEVQNQDLPHGIKHFFTTDVLACGQSGPLEHTIPRFLVPCGGAFNHEVVIDSFVKKLLHDLVQHYVQLVHHRSHACKSPNEKKVTNVSDLNSQSEKQRMENEHVAAVTETSADPERIVSNSMASCRGDHAQQGINSDSLPSIRGPQNNGSQHSIHEDAFLQILPSKVTKGSSTIAIGTFGYQILRCPQFAELCWVTSKLGEGPCSNINGPWKGWPFNSCVMHEKSSPGMVAAGVSASSLKYREHNGVVRGLVAVGLLAYKGVYTSVREVATEVRKVSELLVGQIREKILSRKDKYHYLRILSQIAYLEDMVNSWAYTFQRSNAGNLTTESNTKLAGRVYADNSLVGSNLANKSSCVPSSHEAQEALPEESSEKVTTSKGCCINPIGEISDQALCNSDARIIPELSAPCPTNLASPSLAVTSLAGGDDSCIPVGSTPYKRLDSPKQFNGLELTHNSPSLEAPDLPADVTKPSSEPVVFSNGLDTVLSSKNAEMDKPSEAVDFKLKNSSLAMSENSCLYDCCSGCLHAVYMLAHDTVSQCWESSDCCSTIDDIHDTVSSCSSNLLAAFKQLCISGCSTNSMEFYNETQSERCACQDLVKEKVKNMSSHYKSSRKMDYLTSECSCHSKSDESSAVPQTESTSLSRQSLTFAYRNGIPVQVDQHEDFVLHCRYEKLCLCSIVEMLLTIKRPLS